MPANKERGEIAIKVGEKEYVLRPTFESVCKLDEVTGKTIDDLFVDIALGKLSGLRTAVWCLLQEHHGDEFPTLKSASEFCESVGVETLLAKLAAVQELNTEPATGRAAKAANPRRAQVGTGKPSSKARSKSA